MKKVIVPFFGLCFLVCALIPTAVPAAQMNVIWTSEVGQFAPLWVTEEAKLFEKYGNQVQLIFIQGASSAAAALISGNAQVGLFSPQVVLTTAMQGADLVMLGRLGNFMENRIYGRQGITDIRQIRSLAISRFASNADFAGRFLLERMGLKPDTEVAFLQVGNQSNRIAAIATARADAAILTPPMTLKARKMGFHLLLDATKLAVPYSSTFFVLRKSYVAAHRDDVRNFIKAMIEGIHYYKANKEFSLKVLAKYMKVQDREVLEENFSAYDFPLKPYPAREYFELPIQEVAKKEPRLLQENPDRFVDASFVREMDESGFIDRLTKTYGVK